MPLTQDNTTRPGHWLLDVEVGGAVYRFADSDQDVTAGSLTYVYAAGLDDLAVTLGEGPTTVAITLEPYAGGISWAEVVSRGADVASGTATLRRWHEGQDRREAIVVATGRVMSPEYGADDEPLTFSFDSSRWDSTETVPPSTALVDPTTWPISLDPSGNGDPMGVDPEAIGAAYPWVYGYPGRNASQLWGTIALDASASPAYVAEVSTAAHLYTYGKWVIAGHAVGAATVRITDTSGGYTKYGGTSETLAVTAATDLRGRLVSVIEIGLGHNIHIVAGNEYWITWDSTGLGGRLDPETGLVMRRAGRVIEDLLQTAGVAYDRGRMAAFRARFDRLLVDCAITEAVRPEDWVDEHFGSLLPLLRREGPEGVWYELWRYDAGPADVEMHLVGDPPDEAESEGVPVLRDGPVRWGDASDVENDITLEYLASRAGYVKSIRMIGDAAPDGDVNELGSYLCAVSQARYGTRSAVISTDIIADDASAQLALQWRASWKTLARRSIVVYGGPELAALSPNSVVTYGEAALYLDRALALVREVSIGLDEVTLLLELLDRPDRRGRAS